MLDKLQRSVWALAQSAEVQLTLYPDFVCIGDELALDFEEGIQELAQSKVMITDDQRSELAKLDQLITLQSGEHNADFWLDEAFRRSDPRWEAFRDAARKCLVAFSWQDDPPASDSIYIGQL